MTLDTSSTSAPIERVGSREIAEEILQTAFVKIIATLDTVRETAIGWFDTVLRNAICTSHARRDVIGRVTCNRDRHTVRGGRRKKGVRTVAWRLLTQCLMRTPSILTSSLLLAGALAAAACGGSSSAKPTAPAHDQNAAGDPRCPVEVPGTSVAAEDTATGGALVFVTTGDAAELRKRVAAMAAMHNEHHAAMGPLPTGDEAGSDLAGMDHSKMAGMMMISVHSKVVAEDVEGGARLTFVVGPDDVATLQDELRAHREHLSTGSCAMSEHDLGGMTDAGHDHAADHHADHAVADHEDPAADEAAAQAGRVAAETAAYQQAKPVLAKYCAGCHQQGGKKATAKKLEHFDLTSYPFGGHHTAEITHVMREVLGISGGKPTMPSDKPGAVKGDDLALIAAWADAYDAAHPPAGHGEHHDH